MKTKSVSFEYKGKKFQIDAEPSGFLRKIFGLMFKSRENVRALFFEFSKPTNLKIHSFFVFFDFVGVWLDEKNRVVAMKKIKPFTVYGPENSFKKIIEIPVNKKYLKNIKFLVGD